MQNVFCSVRDCGFNSDSGFCLNRLVVINQQGVCKRLTKEGWNQEVSKQFKSSFNPWQEQEKEKKVTVADLLGTRAPVQTQNQTGANDENIQTKERNRGQSQDKMDSR